MVPLCQLMLLINRFVLSLVFSILYVFVVCAVTLSLFPIGDTNNNNNHNIASCNFAT